MKAFVTGSTGLLGGNLVKELVAEGYEVVALVRSEAKARKVLGNLPGVRFVIGDMQDVAAFAPELQGCDLLFHTAAYFREYYQPGDHWPEMERINVKGTLDLLQAAHQAGVKKLIDTSSSGVIDKRVGDESSGPSPHAEQNLYFKSKVVIEAKVKELVAQGLPIIQILPGWMLGPGDAAPTASGQLVLDFVNAKLPGSFDGGASSVDARDVAKGMILAADKGRMGQRYILGGEYYSIRELYQALEKVTGLPAPRRHIPSGILRLFASLSELWSRISGRPSLVTRDGVETMLEKQAVSSNKAINELGVSFRPLEETLRDEVQWFIEQGQLRAEQLKGLQTRLV